MKKGKRIDNEKKNKRKVKEKKNIDKKNNTGKKKHTGRKIFLTILLVILILGGVFVYKVEKNGGGLSGLLATMEGHNENTKKNLPEIRILLLGVSTDIDSELTDTIMVASYNPNTQKGNLFSIPRDTYIGKYPKNATASKKINAIYNVNKDPNDTRKEVNNLTGLDIQYYALIRTEALRQLVDTIGGVKFNVPENMKYDSDVQNLHIDLKAGEQVLDGDKAEQLLRWRHSNYKNGVMTTYSSAYGNDDFGRMRTQRDFIVATLKQTLQIGNIFKIGQILEVVHKNVDTNLELSYIKDYIPYLVDFNTDNLATAALPVTTPDASETNGVSIVLVNKTEANKLIQSMFYPEEQSAEDGNTVLNNKIANTTSGGTTTEKSTKIKIELLNGSGVKSNLEDAKQKLEDAGYDVVQLGTTKKTTKTLITNKKNITLTELNKMKDLMNASSVTTEPSSTSKVDVTITIGADYKN